MYVAVCVCVWECTCVSVSCCVSKWLCLEWNICQAFNYGPAVLVSQSSHTWPGIISCCCHLGLWIEMISVLTSVPDPSDSTATHLHCYLLNIALSLLLLHLFSPSIQLHWTLHLAKCISLSRVRSHYRCCVYPWVNLSCGCLGLMHLSVEFKPPNKT